MQLRIESRNVNMTPRWKKEIESRMATLDRGYEDILHGRVTLTKNSHHKKQANVAEALVVVSLPRRRTLTARKDAISMELRKFREKRRRKEVRTSPTPPFRGVVCKLFPNEGYGFILKEGGGEVYFHQNALQGLTFDELEDGMEVTLNFEEGKQGPQATTVRPVPVIRTPD